MEVAEAIVISETTQLRKTILYECYIFFYVVDVCVHSHEGTLVLYIYDMTVENGHVQKRKATKWERQAKKIMEDEAQNDIFEQKMLL